MKYNNSINKMWLGVLLMFVMTLSAYAQKTQTYKGVVLDETEQPVIGAAVKVVGTTIGVILILMVSSLCKFLRVKL